MLKRQIEPFMVEYLDKKLKNNEFAQRAIVFKDPRALMVEAAKACVGIREATGRNDGKMIRMIQETVGNAVGEPYCIGGIMTLIAYAEKRTGIKSPLLATEHAQTLWYKTPSKDRVKHFPLPGAIPIWANRGKSSGHGEILLFADEKRFHAVGFNTSGSLSPNDPVKREGNGVYYTVRSMKGSYSRPLLGFVKPFKYLH